MRSRNPWSRPDLQFKKYNYNIEKLALSHSHTRVCSNGARIGAEVEQTMASFFSLALTVLRSFLARESWSVFGSSMGLCTPELLAEAAGGPGVSSLSTAITCLFISESTTVGSPEARDKW